MCDNLIIPTIDHIQCNFNTIYIHMINNNKKVEAYKYVICLLNISINKHLLLGIIPIWPGPCLELQAWQPMFVQA